MDRRTFLKIKAQGALWLAGGCAGWIHPPDASAAVVPDIAVAKGRPAAAARAAVELLGGMGRFVKKGNRVLIKPNMSFAVPPERAANTHPEVIRELAVMCKEVGASKVSVLDNPLARGELCLEMSGIKAACDLIDDQMVHIVDNDAMFQEVRIPEGRSLDSTDVMKEALRADVLLAAPVAKSHSSAGVSLSMKGMMGLIYNRRALHWRDLNTGIVDLVSVLKADLTVIDATRVLSTGGPGGPGRVLKKDTVIASADMVAADAYVVSLFEWYGRFYQPSQVPHIREAHERGLGRMDVKNLTVRTVTV